MRIGAKLLLTYLILIGLMGLLVSLVLPRTVQFAMVREEKARLELMVSRQASTLGARLARGIRSRNPADSVAARLALNNIAELLVDETLMVVDDQGLIIGSSRPKLIGESLDAIEQNSRDFIVARAPLQLDMPLLSGIEVAMIRDVSEVQIMANRITRRLSLVLIPAILVALLIAGWVSRGMVKRLRATGTAVEALAEGDLTRRMPEEGRDEITDLARNINYMAERIGLLVDGLRRSEQARKELLVICSHELRTPLTSIGGFAEALRDGVVQGDERKQRYYQIIAAESARLTRLINDMFDMAKLEAGQIELRMQAIAVAPWLVEFAEGFQPVAAEHGSPLELQITPEAERARIYGDRDQLDRVLVNLCSNAVRYSPAGEPVIIRARAEEQELVLEVADKGPGIPLEEQARVFEPFFQGTNKSPDHKGAGLGLAIVRSLAEGHGGQVGFTATPGSGATFWVRLKLVVA